MKEESEVASRMGLGREFQREGSGDGEGPGSPGSLFGHGGGCQEVCISRSEGLGGCTVVLEISEVGRCQVMDRFVVGKEQFEGNALFDGEPEGF